MENMYLCFIFILIICCLVLIAMVKDGFKRCDKYADLINSQKIAKEKEILCILWQLKDYEKFEPAGRDTATRNLVNEEIAKHSSNLRLLEQNTDL